MIVVTMVMGGLLILGVVRMVEMMGMVVMGLMMVMKGVMMMIVGW